MLDVRSEALAWNSACAAVARSSARTPDFVVADHGRARLMAARWRRQRVQTRQPQVLNEHLVSFCVSGVAHCTFDAGDVHLQGNQRPGTLTILRAGAAHEWALQARDEVVHVHVYIPEWLFQRRQGRLRSALGVRDPWLEGFFRLLINEYEGCKRCSRLRESPFLDDTAELLIGHLIAEHAEKPADAAPEKTQTRAGSGVSPLRPALLRRVEAFVQANLASPLPVARLAELASMSDDHFVRAFHAATGQTPHQYVLERRLSEARALLSDSSSPIRAVAQRCGFSDGAHFSVAFRHVCGVTPSQYRRGH